MRLDTILLDEGLATKSQIYEALEYQNLFGGRIESHLFRFGYITEKSLLIALSRQFRCKSVNLSNIDIPENVLNLIPADIALKKVVIPFEFDTRTNCLKVACENPTDKFLADELASLTDEKKIELYLAVGSALKCALIEYYRKQTTEFGRGTDPYNYDVVVEPSLNSRRSSSCRISILNENRLDFMMLEKNLKNLGYDIVISESIDQYKKQFDQQKPDILLLLKSGSARDVSDFITELVANDIPIDALPTVLVPNGVIVNELMPLLKDGIEDVVPIDESIEPLIIKLNRIRERRELSALQRVSVMQDLGTHGTLEDMNIIDLIQAMGTSEKTARISITGHGNHLTIYLDRGNIIFAECDDKTGAEAVYQGISWTRGIWSVDPVCADKLPEPNNFRSNDSILLEGCRLMDEKNRHQSSEEKPFDTFDFTWENNLND